MDYGILDRLLAVSSLFQGDMKRSFEGTSLTETRVHALWVLQQSGPATQQQLAAALSVTPRSVSALVDGLETAGYVTRTAHPTDRRAVLVVLTERASAMMRRMDDDHRTLERTIVDAIAPGDRAAFERGLHAVLSRLTGLVQTETVHYADVEGTDPVGTDAEHTDSRRADPVRRRVAREHGDTP